MDHQPPEPGEGAPLPPAGLPSDIEPIRRYMAEAGRYPLLSREEERSLAARYREHGDPRAAARLVTANLRLVVKIAHEFSQAYRNLLDLIQEGNLGLLQAVKRYDPERGVRLGSYASWWIRAYMLRFLLDNFRLVRVGTTQAQRKLFYRLKKEQERLRALGFEATPGQLAERLDVREEEVREMQERLAAPELSLDAPFDQEGEEGGGFHDILPSAQEAPEERVAQAQLRALLREALAGFAETLEPRSRFIYEKRLVAEEPLTLQELGDEFGITRERARQLEKRVLNRARAYLRRRVGREVEQALGAGS